MDLLPKLTCGEPKGCGSTDMVLFPWKEKPASAKPKADEPPVAGASLLTRSALGRNGQVRAGVRRHQLQDAVLERSLQVLHLGPRRVAQPKVPLRLQTVRITGCALSW